MKTNVIMERSLFGGNISQRTDNEFFSLSDLAKVGNRWRLENGHDIFSLKTYFEGKGAGEFVEELEKKYDTKVKINSRGKNSHTWAHPLLFIDVALAINPALKIEVYGWLYDYLIQNRRDSGDSYTKMCGCLFKHSRRPGMFHQDISKLANIIKVECGVTDWQTASEVQLKLRCRMHDNIALLSDVMSSNKEAIRIGIRKAKEHDNGEQK